MLKPRQPIVYKGIYYFNSYELARDYATLFGYPANRIINYDLGWAIQLRIRGPYVGPAK